MGPLTADTRKETINLKEAVEMANSTMSFKMAMHHVCLVVSDLQATRDFYVDALGFTEIIRPTDFVFHGAYFHNGNVEVHVVQESAPGKLKKESITWDHDELRTGLCSHFAVMVDSFEPFLDALAKRGESRVGGPRVRDDFVEQIYISDPDGNIIELLTQHSEVVGRQRRLDIFDQGIAVPVAPGYPVIDPREKFGVNG